MPTLRSEEPNIVTHALSTEVGNHIAIRQVRSPDGTSVLSTVKTVGGFRFVEERNVHEPAGPGFDDYWYWRIEQESGIYSSEQEAFDDAARSIGWLGEYGEQRHRSNIPRKGEPGSE